MTSANEILKQIKDNDIKFVDLRFTDPKGKMQHVTMDVSIVDEDMFSEGSMFDGSSIQGWKAINESDMVLMPDPETAYMDPFFAQSTMAITCDILDPISGEKLLVADLSYTIRMLSLQERYNLRAENELANDIEDNLIFERRSTTGLSGWSRRPRA